MVKEIKGTLEREIKKISKHGQHCFLFFSLHHDYVHPYVINCLIGVCSLS